jgi:hypothetical protein
MLRFNNCMLIVCCNTQKSLKIADYSHFFIIAQMPAKPLPPVRIWVAPPKRNTSFWEVFLFVFVSAGHNIVLQRSCKHHLTVGQHNSASADTKRSCALRKQCCASHKRCGFANDVALRANVWYNLYHKRGDSNERR